MVNSADLSSNPLFKALDKKYEADIAKGYATALIYFNDPVGIGEHPQHLEELDKIMESIAGAEDKRKALHIHFKNKQI
tara:strand:+ start:444 stop:677 length:234 start_codon:yes stop_codon:yes gene_type:complete